MTRVCSKSFAPAALLNKHIVEMIPTLDDGQQSNLTDQALFHHVRHNVLSGTFYPQLEGSSSPESPSAEDNQHASRESQSNDGSVDAVSDTNDRACVNTPTSSASPANNDLYYNPSTENHHGLWEMGEKMPIVFHPDFICYREAYYTDCVVTFSYSCIEVKGSSVSRNLETFSTHFAIDDINRIQLEYCMRADAGQFKIYATSRCSSQSETVHGASEIEELQFYVHDSEFGEKCEAITSLDGYKAVWDSSSEVDDQRRGVQMDNIKPTKSYFPSCDESFEEAVYPKGDSDAVSISKRDFNLLQPHKFINDTIIDFYIMYLKNTIHPERRHKYHFFNSFFFRKLADMDKDPSKAFDGRAAFLRVRKWTRKVNLFEKDFVFIPVNYSLHWSLIVICHPGEVANMEADNLVEMSRVPCILHMDSLRGTHTGLKDLFQSYLWEEWKERLKEFSEAASPKFLNLRFASLELPQQQNLYDCGLFLLHYVECFLEEDPADVNPFSITKNSHFLSTKWFHPNEPSCKRSYIQRLIHGLLQSHSCENSPSGESERGDHKPNAWDDIGDSKSYHQTSQVFEMNQISYSSLKDPQSASSSCLGLRESFEAESNLQALIDMHFGCPLSFNEVKNSLPSIQEEAEPSGDYVYAAAASTETAFGHHLGAFALPCSSFIESLPTASNTMAASQNLCELPPVEFDDKNANIVYDDMAHHTAKKKRLMTRVEREVGELKSLAEELHL